MKIAVSIPDDVFAEAESLAQRLKTSRSELYSRALTEFVGHHAPERVTEQMNQVLSDIGEGKPDAFRAEAARRVSKRTEWGLRRVRFGGRIWENQSGPPLVTGAQCWSFSAMPLMPAASVPQYVSR